MASVGRPKVQMSDLPEGWKEKALALGKEGASDVEIRCEAFKGMKEDDDYVMSTDLWYRLLKEEPEFSETIKRSAEYCRLWWEKKGRVSLENKEFSPTLWYMNMKNRFGWRDKQDVTTNGKEIPQPIIQLSSED